MNIVQKAFDPPPFYLNICPILRGVFFKRIFEEQLKKELRQELLEDLKLQMEAALSKEFGHEKELLRKIKMCFLSNDNDSERHEETDSQSQDSVSLLERCGYP